LRDNISFSNGGAIWSSNGSLVIRNSTLTGNSVGDFGVGGAIHIQGLGVSALIENSTITNNSGPNGGGIYINMGGTTTIRNTTISGNSATANGGGIMATFGTVDISFSTIANNSNGNLYSDSGPTINLAATILADAQGGADCATTTPHTFFDNGFKLFEVFDNHSAAIGKYYADWEFNSNYIAVFTPAGLPIRRSF
ncbi:MAG: hypothetical protein AAF485_22245, partial [Chloroflexota bacterium]